MNCTPRCSHLRSTQNPLFNSELLPFSVAFYFSIQTVPTKMEENDRFRPESAVLPGGWGSDKISIIKPKEKIHMQMTGAEKAKNLKDYLQEYDRAGIKANCFPGIDAFIASYLESRET